MSIQSEIDALVKEQSAILSKKIMQVIAKAPVSSLTKLALKPASAPRSPTPTAPKASASKASKKGAAAKSKPAKGKASSGSKDLNSLRASVLSELQKSGGEEIKATGILSRLGLGSAESARLTSVLREMVAADLLKKKGSTRATVYTLTTKGAEATSYPFPKSSGRPAAEGGESSAESAATAAE